MLCAKFGLNWPGGSLEDFFLISTLYLLFRNYIPLENGVALQLKKLESSSPKDVLCQV